MVIRSLRKRSCLSQEQLAEGTGLSLRTVQRAEAGHRISCASMGALAAIFDMDVEMLELEMYAMNRNVNEFRELPFWVRAIMGRGWFSSSRRELLITEMTFLIMAGLLFVHWMTGLLRIFVNDTDGNLLVVCVILCFFAYLTSVCIRIGDGFAAWRLLGHSQPRSFFGFPEKGV